MSYFNYFVNIYMQFVKIPFQFLWYSEIFATLIERGHCADESVSV
jgi:hypothetical protein